jgi:hypothetical protein
MPPSGYVPSGLAIYLVVTWLLRAAQKGKAKTKRGTLAFECVLPMRVLLVVLIVAFGAGSFYTAFALKDIWFSAICATLSLGTTLAYPSEIDIDDVKIQLNRWYASPKSIPWVDVARLVYHRGPVTTVVIGKSGTKIAHTGIHSAPEEFRSQCERHTGLKIESKQF